VSEGTNRNLSARNTPAQLELLALYTDPESHNAAALQTDGKTDDMMMPISDYTM